MKLVDMQGLKPCPSGSWFKSRRRYLLYKIITLCVFILFLFITLGVIFLQKVGMQAGFLLISSSVITGALFSTWLLHILFFYVFLVWFVLRPISLLLN